MRATRLRYTPSFHTTAHDGPAQDGPHHRPRPIEDGGLLYTMARVSLYPVAASRADPTHYTRGAVRAPHSRELTSLDPS